uniref:Uncharacterized protein n=1 Tax=Arundo donax TaxID=35708 RepID=A0A0A9BH82_ARUDO
MGFTQYNADWACTYAGGRCKLPKKIFKGKDERNKRGGKNMCSQQEA